MKNITVGNEYCGGGGWGGMWIGVIYGVCYGSVWLLPFFNFFVCKNVVFLANVFFLLFYFFILLVLLSFLFNSF